MNLEEHLALKRKLSAKNKTASTFRCSPETWGKLSQLKTIYNISNGDIIEALIHHAWEALIHHAWEEMKKR